MLDFTVYAGQVFPDDAQGDQLYSTEEEHVTMALAPTKKPLRLVAMGEQGLLEHTLLPLFPSSGDWKAEYSSAVASLGGFFSTLSAGLYPFLGAVKSWISDTLLGIAQDFLNVDPKLDVQKVQATQKDPCSGAFWLTANWIKSSSDTSCAQ